MTATTEGCGGHAGVSAELRALALTALDRLEPVLDRVRSEPATAAAETCAVCLVCAVIAAVRGERPELAVRLAEQAAGLVTVLRAALEEGGPAPSDGPSDAQPTAPPRPGRRVQRIRIDREQAAR
ncbi:hypothetical protein [Pseudonocardia nigra]|uniref:hypothetical protein n=1 Tax=Pseudonocardia nigra TaxID=1921578 RepID=UPI001C5E22C5|nr:hypothetical protein [Pseudonocardia nigra]